MALDKHGHEVEVSCCPNCGSEEIDERSDCVNCDTIIYRCNDCDLLFSVTWHREHPELEKSKKHSEMDVVSEGET